jgi:hypothetical protein
MSEEIIRNYDVKYGSSSCLLVGVKWPSNEMRSQIVPVVEDLCDLRDKLLEDVELMEPLIAKLPVYADTGRPFVPGPDKVWVVLVRRDGSFAVAESCAAWDSKCWAPVGGAHLREWTQQWYSSREAAQAAADAKERE